MRLRSLLVAGLVIAPLIALPAYVWVSHVLDFSRVEIDRVALVAAVATGLVGISQMHASRDHRIALGVGYIVVTVPLHLLAAIAIGCRFGPCYWAPF
jgi:hypothetical protein